LHIVWIDIGSCLPPQQTTTLPEASRKFYSNRSHQSSNSSTTKSGPPSFPFVEYLLLVLAALISMTFWTFVAKTIYLKATCSAFHRICTHQPPTFQGLAKLKQELVAAAKLCGGADLVSNGCSNASNFTTVPQLCYRLVCNCKLIFQNESNKLNKENGKVDPSIQDRKSTLHNDRLNDRTAKDDEKLAHKTSTCCRKTRADPLCPFTIPLFCGLGRIFIENWPGQSKSSISLQSRSQQSKQSSDCYSQ
jgi:hypothetical protein